MLRDDDIAYSDRWDVREGQLETWFTGRVGDCGRDARAKNGSCGPVRDKPSRDNVRDLRKEIVRTGPRPVSEECETAWLAPSLVYRDHLAGISGFIA